MGAKEQKEHLSHISMGHILLHRWYLCKLSACWCFKVISSFHFRKGSEDSWANLSRITSRLAENTNMCSDLAHRNVFWIGIYKWARSTFATSFVFFFAFFSFLFFLLRSHLPVPHQMLLRAFDSLPVVHIRYILVFSGAFNAQRCSDESSAFCLL